LFGRSQVSEPFTFSTSESFTVTQPDDSGDLPGNGNEGGIVSRFQRLGTDYLIELTFEQPVSVRIGTTGESRCLPEDVFHAGLSCGKASSIEACLNCHSTHQHPVNVSPTKQGTTIPPEFPTLQGGRLTCTSCHEPHGSNYMYFTRKYRKRELCVSCHLKAK